MVKHYTYNFNKNNHLIGVMVSILTSIEVDCRFHHLTSQIRDNKIGIIFFYLQESMEFANFNKNEVWMQTQKSPKRPSYQNSGHY